MKKTYDIEIDCAQCAIKCENAIKKIKGVDDCNIDFMRQKMTLEAEEPDELLKDCIKCAKKIEPDFGIEGAK